MSRPALQLVLAVGGVVAIIGGVLQIAFGPSALPGSPGADETVDNELRFLSAYWLVLGAVLLWIAPRVERETLALRAAAGAIFLGGVARGVSWISVGRPHSLLIVLMAIELVAPAIVIAWQASVVRESQPR